MGFGPGEYVAKVQWLRCVAGCASSGSGGVRSYKTESSLSDLRLSDVVHTEGGPLRLTRPPKNRKGLDLGRDEQDRIAKAVGF